MENTNKSYECSECGKDLHTHKGSDMLAIYLPTNPGLTMTQPKGSQCSKECYTDAAMKRHQTDAKTIIDNWKKNRKG